MKLAIPDHVGAIITRLEAEGHEAYAVGGAVRDRLMGIVPDDWDMCSSALPEEVMEIFSDCRVIPTGIKHGTVTIIFEGRNVEITTFRAEGGYSDFRHPDEVRFVRTIEEDLARRDFTVNAMAYAPSKGLIDLFGGRRDLEDGILRCVGDPEKRFSDDALRILRGLRFMSQKQMKADPASSEAMRSCRELLKEIAYERIDVELMKLLEGKDAVKVLDEYREIFAVIIPELEPMFDFDQRSPYHNRDVWHHTLSAMDYIDGDPELRLAMLFHDIAKPVVAEYDDTGRGHFMGHSEKSMKIAIDILKRMKFPRVLINKVSTLIRYHDYRVVPDRTVIRKMLRDLGEPVMRDLIVIQMADAAGKYEKFLDQAEARLDSLKVLMEDILEKGDCYNLSMLDISGDDLRSAGIIDGKTIGMELYRLLEDVIEDRLPNEKEALLELAVERNGICQGPV